ncbi:MAG: glycosyltransferase family 1 protein [bacterium]|nr:glycosyltransferase family 1 protein [bacterium]
MLIGVDASRAFIKDKTGIEEYSYQAIKNLMDKLQNHKVILYVRKNQESEIKNQEFPENWSIKVIKWPYLWTQIGLSLEILFHSVDVLFVPAHTVPIVHPKNTIVTIHGLEYEFCPKAYSFWERIYMRFSIKNSCRWAKKIIAVSENTKKDLMTLYKTPEEKISVIYEGIDIAVILNEVKNPSVSNANSALTARDPSRGARDDAKPYLLFVGRLEERKNIYGIIEAFEMLKEKYRIPHKLVLAGKAGYNFEKIRCRLRVSGYNQEIILKGFVSEEEKYSLFKDAEVFLFPSFYEGFGLPILEAQSAGAPVVTSNVSSMPEIVKPPLLSGEDAQRAGEGDNCSAVLVNPNNPEEIAEAAYKLISDNKFRNEIVKKGFENAKRFSWEKCAEEIADLLKK